MSTLRDATRLLRQGGDLPPEIVPGCVDVLLDLEVGDAEKADFLRALSDKGETAAEAVAFVNAVLAHAVQPPLTREWNGKPLLDCCGPGGGGLSILNVSTALVFVVVACGVPVVKHGNKGVTKKSGSSDVLEALGVRVDLGPETLPDCLEAVGAAFVFAPKYHPAFKAVGPVRMALAREGRSTVFNLLGPLLNPVRPSAQLMGVFQTKQLDFYEEALSATGLPRALLVHGLAGHGDDARPLGEASPYGTNTWRQIGLEGVQLPAHLVERRDLDIQPSRLLPEWAIEDAAHSAQRIVGFLDGTDNGPTRELVLANAAAALIAAGETRDWTEAFHRVREAVDSGAAKKVLEKWRDFSARSKAG
ncbi:MAG: anthranilate phosphoribosyltransferase [Verrucomicrobiota bacterium]